MRQWREIQEVSWPVGATQICLIEASSELRYIEWPLAVSFRNLKWSFDIEGINGCLADKRAIMANLLTGSNVLIV